MSGRLVRLLPAALLLFMPVAGVAQQRGAVAARAAVVPDSLTVGSLVHAAIRLRVPAGVRVAFPDTLAMPEEAEGAGPPELSTDTLADGIEITAAYPVTAWRPGPLRLPPARVHLITETGVDTLDVPFPEGRVLSVLPADTAGIQPRPVRNVLGADRLWWPLLLALLVLALLAGLAWWLWRRRRRPEPIPVFESATPPREVALALLERVRTLRLIENGEIRRAYILMAEALRGYLQAVDREWSADLTTTELAALLSVERADAGAALEVLRRADLVKFAKAGMDAPRAASDLDQASDWVDAFAAAHAEQPELPVLVMDRP